MENDTAKIAYNIISTLVLLSDSLWMNPVTLDSLYNAKLKIYINFIDSVLKVSYQSAAV